MLFSVLALMLNAGADVMAGYAVQTITDAAINGRTPWNDKSVIVGIFALIVVAVGARLVMGELSARFGINVVRDIREKVTKRIEHAKMSELADQSSAIVTRMTSDMNITQHFLQHQFIHLLYSIVVFLFAFTYLATLNWKLALVAVSSVPLTLVLVARFSKPLKDYSRGHQEGNEAMAAVAQDATGGIYVEKAYNLQLYMNDKFNRAADQVLFYSLLKQRRTSYLNPIQSVLRWIPLLSVTFMGGYFAFNGELTAGGLFSFVFLLHYLVNPLTGIQDFISGVPPTF